MGSICHIAMARVNDEEIMEICRNRNIYTLDLSGKPLASTSIMDNSVIILGNEGNGLSPWVDQLNTTKINIPGSNNKGAESLNVSIAAGIFCNHLFNDAF